MNFKEIKELIQILDESSLTEINIEDNKGSVVNLKQKETEIITPQYSQQPTVMASQPSVQTPMANEMSQTSEVNQENETSNYETINAPMVGTFINLHHLKRKLMYKLGIKSLMIQLYVS